MTKWTIPDETRVETLKADNDRLRAALLEIIQSAPTLQYAIQIARDAREGK